MPLDYKEIIRKPYHQRSIAIQNDSDTFTIEQFMAAYKKTYAIEIDFTERYLNYKNNLSVLTQDLAALEYFAALNKEQPAAYQNNFLDLMKEYIEKIGKYRLYDDIFQLQQDLKEIEDLEKASSNPNWAAKAKGILEKEIHYLEQIMDKEKEKKPIKEFNNYLLKYFTNNLLESYKKQLEEEGLDLNECHITLFGREHGKDKPFSPYKAISRKQFAILSAGDFLYLIDLGSFLGTAATFKDLKPLCGEEQAKIKNGARINQQALNKAAEEPIFSELANNSISRTKEVLSLFLNPIRAVEKIDFSTNQNSLGILCFPPNGKFAIEMAAKAQLNSDHFYLEITVENSRPIHCDALTKAEYNKHDFLDKEQWIRQYPQNFFSRSSNSLASRSSEIDSESANTKCSMIETESYEIISLPNLSNSK